MILYDISYIYSPEVCIKVEKCLGDLSGHLVDADAPAKVHGPQDGPDTLHAVLLRCQL